VITRIDVTLDGSQARADAVEFSKNDPRSRILALDAQGRHKRAPIDQLGVADVSRQLSSPEQSQAQSGIDA
jgi:hypothetical protein